MSEVEFDPFAGGELLRVSPTTAPQKEIFTAAKLSDEANTAFNEAIVLEIKGPLDIELLEKCLNAVTGRHDILRATFSPNGENICLQEAKPFVLEYVDLRGIDSTEQEQTIQSLLKNIAISPMNLEEGPLLYAWIKQLENEVYKLIIATHHLVCDGWSFGILLTELRDVYTNNGSESNLPSPESFFDFAEQQAVTQITNADTDYWLEQFRELPPSLDLPLDYSRPPIRSFRAARYDYNLNKDLVSKLPKAASQLKSSLVNFVMAGYFTLLHRISGNNDIVVGLPVAGQAVLNKHNLFGHMVQLLPIRLHFENNASISDVVAMVKKEVLNASEHPNFTFGSLLENIPVDRSRVPLVSTIFNIDQPLTGLKFDKADVSISSVPRAAESFEIFLNIVPSQDDLLIEATYSSALFKEDTIKSWLQALETILANAVKHVDTKLDELSLANTLPETLTAMNQTEREFDFENLISAFDACVSKTPETVAVISGSTSLTYSQLNKQVNNLASLLIEQGITENSVVGVCCDRTEKLPLCCLAILKLGAAYLPLDPDFPEDRLTYMLEDSGAIAVIEDKCAPQGVRNASIKHLDLDHISLDEQATASLPAPSISETQLAYTIYTSGSTGKPKGVRVPHNAMINFLQSMADRPGFSPQDNLLAITTLSFDISVLELFLPLVTGGTTIVANREDVKSGDKLAELINKHGISVMQATPSTWRMLLASNYQTDKTTPKLKALCGGEPLPHDLISDLLPFVSELWNMYGPTETTVWSTCKRILPGDELVSVGTPIANTQVYILDSTLNPLPVSVPGELCIAGKGITLGYHNRPELTQDRFIDHPKFGRLYRTGDLSKLLPTGEIEHLGRMDDQVKLRGYRIELGEIESALNNCNEVDKAAVYLWKLSEQDVRLVACCVPHTDSALETISIRKQLRAKLPNYMVPQYFLSIESLPLTPNGKIDKRNLPTPEINESTILGGGELKTDTEKTIATIWSELLKSSDGIGREDNFFEIGGHSLLAMEAIHQIEVTTGARLEPADMVSERLRALAEKVANSNKETQAQKHGPQALASSEVRYLGLEQMRLLQRQLSVPNSTANNLPAAWILEGDLDLELFKSSILREFERQTALRTIVVKSQSDDTKTQDYQLRLRHINELSIPDYLDYSNKEAPLESAISDVTRITEQPFDMFEQLLCRVMLYKLDNNRHLFAIIPHQLIFDGWSFDIFLNEVSSYYSAAKEGHAAALAPLDLQYRDFTHWSAEQSPDSKILNYHRRTLTTPSTEELPFKPTAMKATCQRISKMLDKRELDKLESFCETNNLRIYETLLAALSQCYSKWVDNDVCQIGLPVTGRYIPEVIGLVGGFVSTLPAEIQVPKGNFAIIAQNVADQVQDFYQHQELSLAELIQGTSFAEHPFSVNIPVTFAFQDIRKRATQLADLKLKQIDIDRQQTEYPIEFWTRIQNDGIQLVFDYDDGQVEKNALEGLTENISNLLKSLNQLETLDSSIDQEFTVQPATKKTLWRRLFQ